MKFDYCLGNPPYQDPKTGSTKQLWFDFLEATKDIASVKCMIHPGRWVIPTKAYEKYRDAIINDLKCNSFKYYPNAEDVFSIGGLQIGGGISITFFNKNNTKEPIYYVNDVNMGNYHINDKIFSSLFEQEAYSKIFNKLDNTNTMSSYIYSMATLGYHAFEYIKDCNNDYIKDTPDNMKNPIKIWITKNTGRGVSKFKWYFIDKEYLVNIPDKLYSKKVMISSMGYGSAATQNNVFNHNPEICDNNQIGMGSFFIIPVNERERELQLIKSLFMTRTARYLMLITQKTMYVCGFENVPDYLELAKLLPEDQLFSDEWFYKTFDFSKELINEIETRVSEKVEK